MTPPCRVFDVSALETEVERNLDGKKRKGGDIDLSKCQLMSMLQYDCQIDHPERRDSPARCWPVQRLFRNRLISLAQFSRKLSRETPTLRTIKIENVTPDGRAVLFTYNQPHISNAFTVQQYLDLATALAWARDHPKVLVIVLTGAGKHYCAGKVLQSPDEGGSTIDEEIEAGSRLGLVLNDFPKVLIAAVNGAAIGWGCTQLWNFDLVYASSAAFFQTPFTRLGFVPEGGSSYTFPHMMGRPHAMRLLLGSERVTAQEMYISGFVTEVVGDDGDKFDRGAFVRKVCEKAKTIASFPEESVSLVKELTSRTAEVDGIRRASERERVALSRVLKGDAAKKAMSDFAARSKSKKSGSKL